MLRHYGTNMTVSASFIPDRPIVLIGMMGAGKTAVGRRLAARLHMPFVDSDAEIETAAGMSIARYFEQYGEPAFREGERRVITRLMEGPACVIATGGGAFMDPTTRALIKDKGVSVWLKADIEILLTRTGRRDDRPLLRGDDPRAIMLGLLATREPVYAEADLVVETADGPIDTTVDHVIEALHQRTPTP